MSEYTPITDGLRESMARMHVFGRPMVQKEEADFNRMCDAIDSAYAQLEHENAALKAELDRVLYEQEEHQHSISEVTVTVTPRLDWSAVVADLRELTALCECTMEDE